MYRTIFMFCETILLKFPGIFILVTSHDLLFIALAFVTQQGKETKQSDSVTNSIRPTRGKRRKQNRERDEAYVRLARCQRLCL